LDVEWSAVPTGCWMEFTKKRKAARYISHLSAHFWQLLGGMGAFLPVLEPAGERRTSEEGAACCLQVGALGPAGWAAPALPRSPELVVGAAHFAAPHVQRAALNSQTQPECTPPRHASDSACSTAAPPPAARRHAPPTANRQCNAVCYIGDAQAHKDREAPLVPAAHGLAVRRDARTAIRRPAGLDPASDLPPSSLAGPLSTATAPRSGLLSRGRLPAPAPPFVWPAGPTCAVLFSAAYVETPGGPAWGDVVVLHRPSVLFSAIATAHSCPSILAPLLPVSSCFCGPPFRLCSTRWM
jgi:hypothetical protein